MTNLLQQAICFHPLNSVLQLLIILGLSCLMYQADRVSCPMGWRSSQTPFCYYLSQDYSEKAEFNLSVNRCTWMESEIATIDTGVELKFLSGLSRLIQNDGWWLGDVTNSSFLKQTSFKSFLKYDFFSSDNVSLGCVSLQKGRLDLVNCTQSLAYICKRRKGLPIQCDMENGWNYIQGSCFRYFAKNVSWENAKEACDNEDAQLAMIQTQKQLLYVWLNTKKLKGTSWNGFMFNNGKKKFEWTDGSPLIQWWNTSNSGISGNDSDICGVIDSTMEIQSAWTTGSCFNRRTYTCVKPKGVCPEGWNGIEDICFKLFVEPRLQWIRARDYCSQKGAQLLKITSLNIHEEVLRTARSLQNSLTSFWIGISDKRGKFTWTDGTLPNFTLVTSYVLSRSKRLKGKRRGFVSMGVDDDQWSVSIGSSPRSFGCSMPKNNSNTGEASNSSSICEEGWHRIGNSCIYYGKEEKSWQDANSTCNMLQSQLLDLISATDYLPNILPRNSGSWVSRKFKHQQKVRNLNIDQDIDQDIGSCPLLRYESNVFLENYGCNNKQTFLCEKNPVNSSDHFTTNEYDADCGMMWEKRPGTDLCYQFRQAKMTWPHALQHCIDQNSSLASITTSEEQKYIEDKLRDLHFSQFWIGASDRRQWFNIEWEDKKSFIYSNWEQGKPEFLNVPNCIGINSDSMKWIDYSCYLSIGFICKKKAFASHITTPSSTTNMPRDLPSNTYHGCPPDWHKYGGYCYQINTEDATYLTAELKCNFLNSNLASIHSKEENGFLWSLLSQDKIYWIDRIVDSKDGTIFWTDHTNAGYTNWAITPSSYTLSSMTFTMSIDQKTGKWPPRGPIDDIADGYICKKPTVIVSSPTVQQYSTGCMEEGYAYAEYCYTMYNNLTSFLEAEGFCHLRNGNLAVISDRVTNDFLSSVFGHRIGSNFWIGLSVVKGKRNWVRQILPSEEFWERDFTGNDDGCASMNLDLQNWQLKNCSSLLHFVCETVRQGFTTQTVPTTTTSVTPTLEDCPSDWTYNGGFCYKLFDSDESWHEARYHCESLGGNLPSIHDESTNSFIASFVVTRSVWIGLHDTSMERAFEWSDGSPLDFSRWSESEPNSADSLEDCTEIYKQGTWNDVNCHNKLPYVCSLKSGSATMPAPITTTPAPRCLGSDWIYYNGFCYFFNGELKTWQDAENDCLSRGGHLASVLSEEENNFLTIQMSNRVGIKLMWIGYNRLKSYLFVWSDGQQDGFELFINSGGSYLFDRCVSINVQTGGWHTYPCDFELEYICKKINESTVSTTSTATQRMEKFCPAGFVGSDKIDKCYTVRGLQGVDWQQAISACDRMYSKLASINSAQEQDVVNTFTSTLNVSLWIGLKDDSGYATSFTWQDGSSLAYTYWLDGYPQRFLSYPGVLHPRNYPIGNLRGPIPINHPTCVVLIDRWVNTRCTNRYAYVCQIPAKFRDVTITERLTNPPSTTTEEFVNNIQTSTELLNIPPSTTTIDINNKTSKVHVKSQLSISSKVNEDVSTLLSKDSGTTIATFTVIDPATKSHNVDSFTDRFSDQQSTTTVNLSLTLSNDSVHLTTLKDNVNNQSSTLNSGTVNVTSLRSDHKVSDDSLTKTDTALIVLGLLALVSGISFVVTKIIRYKRRRAQIPIRPVSKEGGFLNVLYSSIHEPDL